MNSLVDKLHKEGKELKEKKEKFISDVNNQQNNALLKETELVTNNSNLIILKHFLKDFESCLLNLFHSNNDCHLNFEETCNLLYSFGFIKQQYEPNKLNEETEEVNISKISTVPKDSTKEYSTNQLLHTVWKYLTLGKNEIERVDSNQILVFCAAVLGLYVGDNPDQSSDFNTDASQATLNQESEKKEEKSKDISASATKSERKDTKDKVIQSESKKGILSIKLPPKQNVTKEDKAPNLDIPTTRSMKKDNKPLLKILLPNLDLKKYSFNFRTTKHINNMFHQFFLNRMDFMSEAKNKAKEVVQITSAKRVSKAATTMNTKSQQICEDWRKKCFEVINNIIILVNKK